MLPKICRFVAVGWVAAATLCAPVSAGGNLVVDDAWVRALPPGQSVTALYFSAANQSAETCLLRSVTTPDARRTELHRTTEEDGMARMRLQEVIAIPAGARAEFTPGGDHVMLFDLTKRLEPGDRVAVELDFGDCGRVTVEADVRAATGVSRSATHHHH